jgi:hypothetical protein
MFIFISSSRSFLHTWQLAPALTRKLLTRFYPQTEETSDADRNRIDEAWLRLTVTKTGAGVARARFDGKLRMKHSYDVLSTPNLLCSSGRSDGRPSRAGI